MLEKLKEKKNPLAKKKQIYLIILKKKIQKNTGSEKHPFKFFNI